MNLTATATSETRVLAAVLTADYLDDLGIDPSLYYIDRDTGDVYERQPQDGDDPASDSWASTGKFFPPGDGAPPSQVTGVVVTAVSVVQPDGATVPGFTVSWDAVPESDVIQYEVQYDPSPASWATPTVRLCGTDILSITVDSVLGNADYDFRVRALDVDSLPGAWSATVTQTSSKDTIAPAIPTELTATPGYKMIGLTWSRNIESDFSTYQVNGFPTFTPADEFRIQTRSNRLIVDNLDPTVEYTFRVRAIDRSGNVSDGTTNGVDYETNPESGWSSTATATPLLIGPSDLTVQTVVANFISTGELEADSITSGNLSVGGTGNATSISVYDTTNAQVAEWTDDGLVIWDPSNPTRAIWLYGDSIKFSEEYDGNPGTTTWSTAIDSRGVNASAILFGSDIGGHNRVPNAGMEAAPFPTVAPTSKVWTSSTDWGTATNTVNLATGTGDLGMTSV